MKKNILLIMPKFVSMESYVSFGLERLGYQVIFWEDDYSVSNWPILSRLAPPLAKWVSQRFYSKKVSEIAHLKIDVVLVVKGSEIKGNVITEIRNLQPLARFVLYLWDSVHNSPNGLDIAPQFDRVFSFDSKDSIDYGFTFRPIFFPDHLHSEIKRSKSLKTVFFLGSYHSDRISKLDDLAKAVPESYSTDFSLLRGRVRCMLDDILHRNRGRQSVKIISKRLEHKDVLLKMAASAAVLDINHDGQSGLTQRAAECLFLETKLITDNKSVIGYDFYNPANINLIDLSGDNDFTEFLQRPYEPVDSHIVNRYSLSYWIEEILETDGNL